MVICLFGESCTGKSTIAAELAKKKEAKIYTGNEYLKLAKNESEAKKNFKMILEENVHTETIVIYVVSDKEQLEFLPEGTIRILVTADLDVIKERFAQRMGGHMPAPVAAMLERKHGMFDKEEYELKLEGETVQDSCEKVKKLLYDPRF